MSVKPTGTLWKQFFQRWAGREISLQGQIRQMLVSAILDGQLPTDVPIPSSRQMSGHLGVARNTVVIAYQQLVDEGFLVPKERKGYFINRAILSGPPSGLSGPPPGLSDSPPGLSDSPPGSARDSASPVRRRAAPPNWARRFVFQPSAQRNIVKRADWQHFPYPFLYGQFDASLFPAKKWRECCTKTLSVLEIGEWAQDMFLRDDESLVRQLRMRVLPRRGIWASDDEIVITVGAQQALYLIANLLMNRRTSVGIEDPGYPDARNIFASRSSRILGLPLDEQGLQVSDAMRSCDYVYVTPSHQCPTTVPMPIERREALLDAAQEHDVVLIEDDYESENRSEGEATPTLKSLDRAGRVIYVGSLSKSLAPGLRLGYIVAPKDLIAELRALRRLNLRHPTAYMQRAFALFLSLGHHDALLRRLSAAHRERAQVLSAALDQYLPDFRYVPIAGGASCWVEGPAWLDADALARHAEAEGVLIEPGSVFFMSEKPPKNCFRLGFSSISADRIEAGIATLADALQSMRSEADKPFSDKHLAGPIDTSQLVLESDRSKRYSYFHDSFSRHQYRR